MSLPKSRAALEDTPKGTLKNRIPGGRDGRRMLAITMVDKAGNGLWTATQALYFTYVTGLSLTEVGLLIALSVSVGIAGAPIMRPHRRPAVRHPRPDRGATPARPRRPGPADHRPLRPAARLRGLRQRWRPRRERPHQALRHPHHGLPARSLSGPEPHRWQHRLRHRRPGRRSRARHRYHRRVSVSPRGQRDQLPRRGTAHPALR